MSILRKPQATALQVQVGDGREREREEEDEVGSSASRCAGKSSVSQACGVKSAQNSPGTILSGFLGIPWRFNRDDDYRLRKLEGLQQLAR